MLTVGSVPRVKYNGTAFRIALRENSVPDNHIIYAGGYLLCALIESDIGKGTEITLFLPRAAADDISEEQTKGGSLERGKGRTILVLEDEHDVRDLALTILDGLGYRVFGASDANAAMQVLEEEADNIDLLLSDVVLPGGVNGPEFAAKAHQLYPKLKVIFMTGYTSDASLQSESIATGIPVLTKPFRTAALANAVHDILGSETQS